MPGFSLTPSGGVVDVRAPAADQVELCLFDVDGTERRLPLAPDGGGWHRGTVADVQAGQRYGFRTHGPWKPEAGLWHRPELLLVDPHARAISGTYKAHPAVGHTGPWEDTAPRVPRSVVVEPPPKPRPGPQVPWEDTVVYETHVRGLTMAHPEVGDDLRGTYLGACSPPILEHLHRLGVTTVEFLPVAHHVTEPFLQERGMVNYWGYSTLGWFAPHGGYATADDGRQVAEFATMVDRFHEAGLEVIVDVVFNHTAEGNAAGPILSMKGLDNPGWYRLAPDGGYLDWTGTGNTVDTGKPAVRAAIVEALSWWAGDLGVDGFRFDLAVTLGRRYTEFHRRHLAWLTQAPELAGLKLIAEPWDLGPHGYRLGGFGDGWVEWNSQYRDQVRDLWRGRYDAKVIGKLLAGSPDLFAHRAPEASVNFVTAHDGFTLADLVAYEQKHNEANGEHNRDGHDDNRAWNSGVEGPTDDPGVLERRQRRAASLLSTLFVSAGVPMIQGGDELGRSLAGNNNAYPADEPNWYDWTGEPFVDQISAAAAARRRHPALRTPGSVRLLGHQPLLIEMLGGGEELLIVINATDAPREARLPPGDWDPVLDSTGEQGDGTARGAFEIGAWTLCLLRRRRPQTPFRRF